MSLCTCGFINFQVLKIYQYCLTGRMYIRTVVLIVGCSFYSPERPLKNAKCLSLPPRDSDLIGQECRLGIMIF